MLIAQRPVITTEKIDETRSKFIFDPLEPGSGYTLANSLRRTLLKSIPGAAVSSIVIEGVDHEFDTVPGVKEDVVDIVQNIKNLVVSSDFDEPVSVLLHTEKAGTVTAGDIKTPTGISVLNKDMVICTLSKDAKFDMELVIQKGRGYVSAADNKANDSKATQVNRIYVDSIYTPVLKVSYKVEATRVGQRTDFDKFILDIETKPSITPINALSSAGKTLVELFGLAHNLNPNMEGVEIPAEDVSEFYAGESIEVLGLTSSVYNGLRGHNINTLDELIACTPEEIVKLPKVGQTAVEKIEKALKERGLSLAKSGKDQN